jgi:hypothetical protein
MFTPYTAQDLKLQPDSTNWLNDKIVNFTRQRTPILYAVRQQVAAYGDTLDKDKKTSLKHYIPWIRFVVMIKHRELT